MRCAARSLVHLAVAMLLCSPVVAANMLINDFDDAGELWRYDFGSPITPSITLDAAEGSPDNAQGAMRLDMSFSTSQGGNNVFAFTNDAFFPATDLSGFDAWEFDLKIVDGAAQDAFGNYGFFQIVSRETDGYSFNTIEGLNLLGPTGEWRTFSVPTDTMTATRALTLQLYGGPAQNIDGSISLLIDNVRLTMVIPEPSSAMLALLSPVALVARRRFR